MRHIFHRSCILSLCAIIAFSSCNATISDTEGKSSPEYSTVSPVEKTQMKIISSQNGIIASGMVGNDYGCYEIFYRPSGDGNILYTDYATQSRIYLSSQVSAERNSENDTSWLESTVGGCYFSLTSENLLLFKLNTPNFNDQQLSERQGYIARYDLNGANRKVLTQLSPNEVIADGCIVSDSNNIYYLTYYIQDDGTSSPFSLTSLNILSGEKKKICEFSADSRHFIVGAYQDKIVMKNIVNPVNFSSMSSAEEITEAFRRQRHEIVLLSPDGRQESICQWKQGERSEMFTDDKMFYWDTAKKGIYELDFETGKEKSLNNDPIVGSDGTSYNSLILYADPFDGHILATATQEENGQEKSIQIAFDIENKVYKELKLIENERPVQILAEGANYFLVQTGLKEYPIPDYMPDGQQYTTNMLVPDIYLIAKQDYWNSIPNYIPIKDDVYI